MESPHRDKVIPAPRTERVFLTWTIHHSCNYRCSYCFITTGYRDIFSNNTYPGLEKLIATWDRIYDLYGSCIIKFAGGEPFTYPNFFDLIERLGKRHFLDFSSNLSWDVQEFVRRIPRNAARIEPSYHPEFCPDIEGFAQKCLTLKEHGFMGSVHLVGYPPLLHRILEAKKRFESKGLNCVILPFRGGYKEKIYPDSYTDEEKNLLQMAIGHKSKEEAAGPSPAASPSREENLSEEKKHIRDVNTRYFDWYVGKENHFKEAEVRWCLMGSTYGKIQPNGDVLRCCTPTTPEKQKELVIGNILDSEFRLLDGAKACDIRPCACWKPMLLGEDQKWKPLWRFETYPMPDAFERYEQSKQPHG